MFTSKKLKNKSLFAKYSDPKSVSDKIKHFLLFEIYHPIVSFFSRTHERVSRSLAFAKFGYFNYDFDGISIFDVMSFKMKRVLHSLENYSSSVQEKKDLDALKLAIKLTDNLANEVHEEILLKKHDRKWGKAKLSKAIPEYDENGKVKWYRMPPMKRSKIKTDADRKTEFKERKQLYLDAVKNRRGDIMKLAEILDEHLPRWWD